MMKLLVIALFTFNVFATYPYFKFGEKKLKLTKEAHSRYIRPQLKNIKTEYYLIAKKLSPIHGSIIKLRESALKFIFDYNSKYVECEQQQKEQAYCELDVSELLSSSYEVDRNIQTLRKESIHRDFLGDDNIAGYMLFSKHLDEVEILNSQIQRYLELKKIVNSTVYTTYTPLFTDLSNTVIRFNIVINFVFIDLIPETLQDTFEALLVHFIAPLEERMINKYSPDWFILELGKLNLTWNTYHMNLEKGSKEFPEQYIKIVKLMHNRWNSILKLIF